MAESLQTDGSTGDILSPETQSDPFAKSDSVFAPNDFYHVISDVMDWSINTTERPRSLIASRVTIAHYYILVLIIPNDFINVRETIFKFVEASHKAPLSIVIFGIGNASSFKTLRSINMNTKLTEINEKMEPGVPMRDYDDLQKTIQFKIGEMPHTTSDLIFKGLRAVRDVVTFVRLNDFENVESCVEKALKDIPKQMCKFMRVSQR
jgi:hypothetical protein